MMAVGGQEGGNERRAPSARAPARHRQVEINEAAAVNGDLGLRRRMMAFEPRKLVAMALEWDFDGQRHGGYSLSLFVGGWALWARQRANDSSLSGLTPPRVRVGHERARLRATDLEP